MIRKLGCMGYLDRHFSPVYSQLYLHHNLNDGRP